MQAIEIAKDGDTVLVGVGVWREHIDLLGKSVILRSLMGAEETVINGGGIGPVIRCVNGESSSTLIEGFTITGASFAKGVNIVGTVWRPIIGPGSLGHLQAVWLKSNPKRAVLRLLGISHNMAAEQRSVS